ncbi:hypothetical protein S245_004862, partial [Arachis hypogaea]
SIDLDDHRSRFQCREEFVLFSLTERWRKMWRMEIWSRDGDIITLKIGSIANRQIELSIQQLII